MKVGVLIPTRGDRPQFLSHAFYLLERQLLNIDFIEVVNDRPISNQKDITYRYRIGCERLVKRGADIIFFWEDDDYYSNSYLLKMYDAWIENGKPSIFGIGYSIYYHIGLRKWVKLDHPERASAMSTMVTKDIVKFNWPTDSEPYTDLFLWKGIKGRTVSFETIEAIGIKHGVGLCGGGGHNRKGWYLNNDPGLKWLGSKVDDVSLDFYGSFPVGQNTK
jgi:hypothetical protein